MNVANTKKTTTTTAKPVEKRETIKTEPQVVVEAKESSNPNNEVDVLKQQLADLQALMIKMQSNQMVNTVPTSMDEDTLYEISTRSVNSTGIYSQDKRITREIPPFGGVVTVDGLELRELLKSNFVRDWFESDIIYFKDESVYDKKRITKRCHLDDESFTDLMMNNSTEKVVSELNRITRNFKDEPVIHCVFYRIIELCYEGKLTKMDYATRQEIEKLFGTKIDDAQMFFRGFKEIK